MKTQTNQTYIDFTWAEDEDFPGRAWGDTANTVYVNGHPVHILAYQVEEDVTGLQSAVWPSWVDEVEHLQDIAGGALNAYSLPGLSGEWIIAITSHGT